MRSVKRKVWTCYHSMSHRTLSQDSGKESFLSSLALPSPFPDVDPEDVITLLPILKLFLFMVLKAEMYLLCQWHARLFRHSFWLSFESNTLRVGCSGVLIRKLVGRMF